MQLSYRLFHKRISYGTHSIQHGSFENTLRLNLPSESILSNTLHIKITMSNHRKVKVFGETTMERQRRGQEELDALLAAQMDLEEEQAARERGNERLREIDIARSRAEEEKNRQLEAVRLEWERKESEKEDARLQEILQEREREKQCLKNESDRRKKAKKLRDENSIRVIQEQARIQAEEVRAEEAKKAAEGELLRQDRLKRKAEEGVAAADRTRGLEEEGMRSDEKSPEAKLERPQETTESLPIDEDIELQRTALLARLRATLKTSNAQHMLILRPPEPTIPSDEAGAKPDSQPLRTPDSPREVPHESPSPSPRLSESTGSELEENMWEFILRMGELGVDLGDLDGGVEAAYKRSQNERRDAPPPNIPPEIELEIRQRRDMEKWIKEYQAEIRDRE